MRRAVPFVIFALALAGCQSRLNQNTKTELAPTESTVITVDAPKYDQKARIEFSSSDGPVSICVGLKKHEAQLNVPSHMRTAEKEVLAKADQQQSGVLEASVPAKEEFVVIVTSNSAKKTTVTLKITGK